MVGRLSGKVAIVTGASRGMGQYCALGYAAEGATVAIAARGPQPGDAAASEVWETVRLIEEKGGKAFPVPCDIGSPESIQAMVQTVLGKSGRIDVLMNNAIRYPSSPGVTTIEPRDWEACYQVNVHGVFHAIRAVLPTMVAQHSGSIISISSAATNLHRENRGNPNRHYGGMKWAIVALSLGVAEEMADKGVAANTLRPVRAIATPGSGKGRSEAETTARAARMSPPDSYVEAGVLLGLQTPETCTGKDWNDAEVIKHLGAPGEFERFKAMNAPIWSHGLD
jgi:citronellol/citronellal dehydrogenase